MSAPTREALVPETGEVVALPAAFSMAEYLERISGKEAFERQQALAAVYDKACRALIGPNDIQQGKGRTFKKKSAWLKLARHFGISTYLPDERIRHEITVDGCFIATAVARAVAPWGQVSENVGACATDEATGQRVISKADAIATAATRALNRAISNLIAMGEVSAEEVGEAPADGPKWKGKPMSSMTTDDLVGLRAWFVKQDPKKWGEKITEVDEVLAGRGGE